jgi:ribosome-associated translation inhibitor RaiA/cold shock CspA family protein
MPMQKGLEITYHNMEPTDWLDADIRERVAKLEKMHDRLVGVRVAIEAQHKQHKVGNVYDVHIELFVPGGDLVVSRQPHKAKEKYAHPDVRTSVRDAFQAAERQLQDYKEQLRGDVKVHEPMFQGQISQLYPQEDYGFILTNTGTQLYFHRNSLLGGAEFDKLTRGMAVHYIEDVGDTGPIATKVWLGPEHHMD